MTELYRDDDERREGWSEYRRLILKELSDLNTHLALIESRLDAFQDSQYRDVVEIKKNMDNLVQWMQDEKHDRDRRMDEHLKKALIAQEGRWKVITAVVAGVVSVVTSVLGYLVFGT